MLTYADVCWRMDLAKAAELLERYCGAQHAVALALDRGVFGVALGVAARNRDAMHLLPQVTCKQHAC